MLWHQGVTISLKLNCKYIKQPWFEWKSHLDMNFKHEKYENDNQYKYWNIKASKIQIKVFWANIVHI